MMYFTKKECYEDTLISLRFGTMQEEDVSHLVHYYKELEHYECCAGIVEAYVQYKKELKDARDNKEVSGAGI